MFTAWDRFTLTFAPKWTLERVRARAVAEHLARTYEAAQPGRRTSGWARNRGDVNALIEVAGPELRLHARDLIRNNSYARRARAKIMNAIVGWGIVPKPGDVRLAPEWKTWAESTACDADGRYTFAGLQRLAVRALFSDGEVLVRRRVRRASDGLRIPLQIQILEADHLDTAKTVDNIRNGIEFDGIGRRIAYWLFPEHPGSTRVAGMVSRRVPASEVLHVYDSERPGQIRGVSWLGSAIVNLKDLDEYEDADLMRQKIAAAFAGFVTDSDGTASPLGEQADGNDAEETLEPGTLSYLAPGKQITFASPPQVVNSEFSVRNLRKIAAGLGITYEDLTGDYSQVNFSSARMARITFGENVAAWQSDLLIPQFCSGVWSWFAEAAFLSGLAPAGVTAEWTAPPLAMIEPDKEVRASTLAIRAGIQTPSEVIRERGGDPDAHWSEYAADMAKIEALKLKLDSDPRATSQAGLTQERVGMKGAAPEPPPNEGA